MTTLKINGESKSVDAPDDMPLLWVLRDVLGMTGTKFGCGIALCGACTVHLEGKAVRSCLLADQDGRRSSDHDDRRRSARRQAAVQQAWLELDVSNAAIANRDRS